MLNYIIEKDRFSTGKKCCHHQGSCPLHSGSLKMGKSPQIRKKAAVQVGNVPPYNLVVEKMGKNRHFTCGVWSKSGLSRSECKSVISS